MSNRVCGRTSIRYPRDARPFICAWFGQSTSGPEAQLRQHRSRPVEEDHWLPLDRCREICQSRAARVVAPRGVATRRARLAVLDSRRRAPRACFAGVTRCACGELTTTAGATSRRGRDEGSAVALRWSHRLEGSRVSGERASAVMARLRFSSVRESASGGAQGRSKSEHKCADRWRLPSSEFTVANSSPPM